MSFIKKTLASFGIGSARVDSVLHQDVLYPGQEVSVTIHVYGGASAQKIDNIELKLCCHYVAEVSAGDHQRDSSHTRRVKQTHVLARWALPYAFTIESGETRDFAIELSVPWNTPVTIGDAKVWLETGLDIALAVDPSDKDMLTVRPDPLMDGVFHALEDQGLRIRKVECEAVNGQVLPFVQTFELVPTTGPFHGRWRELEIIASRDEASLTLWFVIDRQYTGTKGMVANMLGLSELQRQLTIAESISPKQAGQQVVDFLDSSS